jgi:hypothetical protein
VFVRLYSESGFVFYEGVCDRDWKEITIASLVES